MPLRAVLKCLTDSGDHENPSDRVLWSRVLEVETRRAANGTVEVAIEIDLPDTVKTTSTRYPETRINWKLTVSDPRLSGTALAFAVPVLTR